MIEFANVATSPTSRSAGQVRLAPRDVVLVTVRVPVETRSDPARSSLASRQSVGNLTGLIASATVLRIRGDLHFATVALVAITIRVPGRTNPDFRASLGIDGNVLTRVHPLGRNSLGISVKGSSQGTGRSKKERSEAADNRGPTNQ
jgi:hypothetical protein